SSGLDRKDLALEPSDPEPNPSIIRQRRYARLKLSHNIVMTTTNLQDNFKLTIAELNLGGGIGSGERHLAPGSLITLKVSHGVRNIKAQAIVRGARPQAMAFEFVEMDLEERSRLRRLLMELGSLPMSAAAVNRARRRGRIAVKN
ncbi:MAG: PilZ domain-containing protein, partial [Acidobacteriota bacterium]|nr:PilZ domain-containing protein [Acidobacteriota bacterium]